MPTPRGRIQAGFFKGTALCLLAMLLLAMVYRLLTRPDPGPLAPQWLFLHAVLGWTGLLLPLAAFAGGTAAYPRAAPSGIAYRAAFLGLLSYVLLAYAAPLAYHRAFKDLPDLQAVRFPLGPGTPGELLLARSGVEADPPDVFSFSVDHPLERPPNWLTYLVHSPVVVAAYTILSALLGFLTADLTLGLPPPARFNARWAAGVLSGFSFLFAEIAAGDWVRVDPLNSGLLGAWGPLILPVLIILGMTLLIRSRGPGLHIFGDSRF